MPDVVACATTMSRRSCRLPIRLAALLAVTAAASAQMAATFTERLRHWAWQPLADPQPPPVQNPGWLRDPLDAFVLAPLERAGLEPAPPAPPAAWLRRVTFDLIGLPPEPALVAAFMADPSPTARARVVDDLLARPQFGERWARHWLDVVRYTETLGHEFDFEIPNAWRYRDYVVRALNRDVPFDQFAKEHIAGDLLTAPRRDPDTGGNESVLATGFYWFAEQTHGPVDPRKHQADRIDNQIDVLSKAFLGLTVACARCHDHKFDAIRSRDYYALFGFLESSGYVQQPVFVAEPAAIAAATAAHRALASFAAVAGTAPAAPLDPSLDGMTRVDCGFGTEPWCGPFVTAVNDDAVVCTELPGSWWNSAALDRTRNGTLLSPTAPLDAGFLHVEVAGQGARLQIVVDGLHLVRDPLYGKLHRAVDGDAPHWVTFEVGAWRGHRAQVQILDVRAPDLADPDRDRGAYPDDAWIAIHRIASSNDAAPPAPNGSAPTVLLRTTRLSRRDPAVEQALQTWRTAIAAMPPPATAPAMADGTGRDEHVFLRGNHQQLAELAPRRFLQAIDGDSALPLPAGSGRLQLAERMFAADDPLPARVLVNRAWHHLFGRGLARTVDNLGHLGEPPTHPELLDRLARDTAADGWSLQRLLRRIVLSATYAMDSRCDPALEVRDADNRLLHRQNLRRLEGEALRDAMLAFAGRLDLRAGGPSVPLPLGPDDKARGRPDTSGPVDGDGRRSIYLAVRRNFLPNLLVTFDLPTPFTTVGARSQANVPAQALALLNDPFVQAMCTLAGEHLVAATPPDPASAAAALRGWFAAAFARPPAPAEQQLCEQFIAAQRDALGVDRTDPRPWAELAHALLARKEFQFLR